MIEFILVYQALIREVINGVCMVLFGTLTILVMVFMWDTWVENSSAMIFIRRRRGEDPPLRDWREVPGIKTACAMWWVFAAETYRTGAIWFLYNLGRNISSSPYPISNIGVFGSGPFWNGLGYLIAGFMLAGGLLRSIYIFTPPEWKRKVWVYAATASAVFVSSPYILLLL